MKIDNFGYIMKGILLAVSGVLIAFFPNVITWIFYAVGIIIIAGSVFTLIGGLSGGDAGGLFGAAIVGILIGLGVIALPKFIMLKIPVIAGLIFGVMGISRLVKGLSSKTPQDKKTMNIVFAVFLLILAVFLIANPFKASTIVRVVIGIVMICFALFDFYVAHVISQRNKASAPDSVIDVSGYTVNDDKKYLK